VVTDNKSDLVITFERPILRIASIIQNNQKKKLMKSEHFYTRKVFDEIGFVFFL